MAKGNLFLGLASGSVGDVTFFHSGGQQRSRARVRQVSNPRSNAQLYQRAILSTVAKAYAAGKAIFDHSFEGYTVPSGAARHFSALNLRALRARVYADVQAQTGESFSNPLVGPRSSSPVAGLYTVSEGSLPQSFITITPAVPGDTEASIQFGSQPLATGTLADYADYHGLVEGDIFTFVFFAWGQERTAGPIPDTKFGYIRYELRPRDVLAATSQSGARLSQMFSITASDTVGSCGLFDGTLYLGVTIDLVNKSNFYVNGIGLESTGILGCSGSFAIIRSRANSSLRSSAQMQWLTSEQYGGLGWEDALVAWREGIELGDSDLILEGGAASRASASSAPLMITNFDNPITLAALGASDYPLLIFPSGVSFDDLVAYLSVDYGSSGPMTKTINRQVLYFYDGDNVKLTIDGFTGIVNSVDFEVNSPTDNTSVLFSYN